MPAADPTPVLGLDIGGTSSRAVVVDLSGRTLGSGEAAGGNPNSHSPEDAARQVALAARSALSGTSPGTVRAGVLGMAGVSKMADAEVSALFERTWSELGLRCAMRVVSDSEVAFAAGAPEPDGTILIAGTGSIAARVEHHRTVATAGGYGWLLGDEGSAFWLGREAARTTLAQLREPRKDSLVTGVLDELLDENTTTSDDDPEILRKRVISAVNAAPPIQLAELAPLVTSAAQANVASATGIVAHAARLLADTAEQTRKAGEHSPIVLAGGLMTEDNPVGKAARAELAERGHGPCHAAGPGAPGAAWLASLDLLDDQQAKHLHGTLLG